MMLAWGITMTLTGLVKDFKGLVIARVFLGVAEAGLFPVSSNASALTILANGLGCQLLYHTLVRTQRMRFSSRNILLRRHCRRSFWWRSRPWD